MSAKLPSPYLPSVAAKQAGIEALLKQMEEEEYEAEAVFLANLQEFEAAEAEKKARHKPLTEVELKSKLSPEFLERCKREYGKLPLGISFMEIQVPKLGEIFEACFFELHKIRFVYDDKILMVFFTKRCSLQEIPVNRFFPEHYFSIEPSIKDARRGYLRADLEKKLALHARPDQIEGIKKIFTSIGPRNKEEARDMAHWFLIQRESPQPKVVHDDTRGPITALAAMLYEGASSRHAFLMVNWLVQHVFKAMPPRPPEAVLEYCLHHSPVHANAFWFFARWCTVETGMDRYGKPPDMCRKMDYKPKV
jgi:hypothetical protein